MGTYILQSSSEFCLILFLYFSLEFEKSLASSKQSVYAGFDPTADSLHIGNLLVIIALLHCRQAGHRPIILVRLSAII